MITSKRMVDDSLVEDEDIGERARLTEDDDREILVNVSCEDKFVNLGSRERLY